MAGADWLNTRERARACVWTTELKDLSLYILRMTQLWSTISAEPVSGRPRNYGSQVHCSADFKLSVLCSRGSWKLVGTLPGMIQTIVPIQRIWLNNAPVRSLFTVMYCDIIFYGTLSFALLILIEDEVLTRMIWSACTNNVFYCFLAHQTNYNLIQLDVYKKLYRF